MGKNIDINEIQKDVGEYVSKKYGLKLRLAGPEAIPEALKDGEHTEEEMSDKIKTINFDMKPAQLKAYLDEYMVKQDEAKQILSTKICTHFNRIKRFELNRRKKHQDSVGEIKNNIIMIGPTGVGKTFLIKLIASKIGVPFVKGDATKFSETGYVGGDVEDLVRDLVHEAKGDIELAQYGIIYLDEVDKLAGSHNVIGLDVSRSGVQRALLKPMEETEVELKVPHDPISQIEAIQEYQKTGKRERKKISTRHILFIMSGAFNGLDSLVKKRHNTQRVGFGAKIQPKNDQGRNLKHVKAEDLVSYGFESEFIGRLPVVTIFEHLEAEDLYKILHNPKSPIIVGKKRDFKAYGIDLQFEDEALHKIAQNAFKEKTGARALVSAMEQVLMKFEHTLPSTDIRHLVVTGKMVDDPQSELDVILADPDNTEREKAFLRLKSADEERMEDYVRRKVPEWQKLYGSNFPDERIRLVIRRSLERQEDMETTAEEFVAIEKVVHEFAAAFSKSNDLEISFTDEAVDCLAEKIWHDSTDVKACLKKLLQNYEHGLKLIKEKTGKRQFIISAETIEDPEIFLNRLIQQVYH